MSWLKPLARETHELLAKERAFGAEPEGLRGRVLTRARGALRAAEPAALRRSSFRRPELLLAAALGLVLASAAFAAWREHQAGDTSSVVPTTEQASEVGRQVAPQAPRPEVATAEETATSPDLAVAEHEVAAASPRPTGSAAAYALELRLLERARAAVAEGDHAAALRFIASHQRRFPQGLLREEREALRVKALAGLGRADEAKRAAERFREDFPRSVVLPGLEQTVKQGR
jgi:hypothetical protein